MANGGTIIKYGDMQICRVQHTLTQKMEQDAAGGLRFWRFTVHGIGYVHGFNYACKYINITTDPVTAAPTSASQGFKQVSWRLKPRQDFILAVGCTDLTAYTSGQKLLEANPMTSVTAPQTLASGGLTNYDVCDGPRCLQMDVVQVCADNIFKVVFHFEVCKLVCDDNAAAGSNTNGVLSHRWSVSDALDHNKRTVRTYTGLLECATSNFSPHWFRYLVTPPLQYGMRRDFMAYNATEDGKHLQYTIVDTEVAYSAPFPATKWEVQHTEATLCEDATKVTSSVVVTLEGEPACDMGQLIILGLYIASAKVTGVVPGAPITESIFLHDIVITVVTGDVPGVRVSASCWRLPVNQANLGIATRTDGFNLEITDEYLPTFSHPYSEVESTDARPGESTRFQGVLKLAGIFRSYLMNPCSPGGPISTYQIGDLNEAAANWPKEPTQLRIVPTIPSVPVPDYSEAQKTATYTTHQVESTYVTRSQRVALPIAGSAPTVTPDLRNTIAIAQIGGAVSYRIVRFLAQRIGAYPELPNPETMDGDPAINGSGLSTAYGSGYYPIPQKMLYSKLRGRGRTQSADGSYLYYADMDIVYALLRAPTPTELLKIGINKWQNSSTEATISNPTLTNSPY